MTVGKATAVTRTGGEDGFQFEAPCFTGIDETRIRDHLEHDLVGTLIRPAWTFWVVGVGSIVTTCVMLLLFFRRKGWV